MFTLHKIALDEGKYSMVAAGEANTLPNLSVRDPDTEDFKAIAGLDDVKEGYQVLLSEDPPFHTIRFHRTSPIREVVSREANKVVFKTQTSLYELTKDPS